MKTAEPLSRQVVPSTLKWWYNRLPQTICILAVAVAAVLNLFGIPVPILQSFFAAFIATFNLWLVAFAARLLYQVFVSFPKYKRAHPDGIWVTLWPLVPSLYLLAGLGLLFSAVYLAPTTWQQLRQCIPD